MDIDGDVVTLLMDVDALPDTNLASVLTDTGGETRLMDYPVDMPIQYHTRAYNMSGTMALMQAYLGTVYDQMGLDINVDEMSIMTESFTGEMAGGMNITSNGLAMEFIAVLQPGTDGEAFIHNEYLPFLERYGGSVSELATGQTVNPQIMTFERTPDSSVAGARVMGIKTNIHTADQEEQKIFDKLAVEMRLASVGDLLFMTSNDATIEKFINGTRSLFPSPARGPMGRITVDLAALFKGIQSLVPSGQPSNALPDNLGKITTQFEMKNGQLKIRTRFSISEIISLISAFGVQSDTRPNTQSGGAI